MEFYLFAALLGASYGGISPLIVPILADYFGTASFGKILGVYFLVTQLSPVFVHNIGAVMYATGQSNTYLSGRPLVAVLYRCQQLLLRHPAHASRHVIASRLFGSILFEAITCLK